QRPRRSLAGGRRRVERMAGRRSGGPSLSGAGSLPVAAVQGQRADDREGGGDEPVQAEGLYGVAGRVAEEVRDQAHGGGPGDAPERVPQQERAPVHARAAGQPGRPHAQAEQEASEEHRLGPVALEEGLADAQHLQPLAVKAPRTLETQRPPLRPITYPMLSPTIAAEAAS